MTEIPSAPEPNNATSHDPEHREDPAGFLAAEEIVGSSEVANGTPLLESLGFVETAELAQLHAKLVEALRTTQDVAQHAVAYQMSAETTVDAMENFAVGQIALTLQLGMIAQEAGQIEMYVGYLEQARTYADNIGQDEIVSRIGVLIEAV